MKKIIFYIALVVSVLLLINVLKIVLVDLNRLTEYGWGYLTGKVVLLLCFVGIMFATRKHNRSNT